MPREFMEYSETPEYYQYVLEERRERLRELEEQGGEALSLYDIRIAFQGDVERALIVSTQLLHNQINYYEAKLEPYKTIPKQMTLFDASEDK